MAVKLDIDKILSEPYNNVSINVEQLNDDSLESAQKIVRDVTILFQDEEWMKRNPKVAARIGIERDTLIGLIKMRMADELVHDALLQAISNNNNNASLYRSLADIQKTSLNVTTKINDTISSINNLMRGFQMDILEDSQNESQNESQKTETQIYRGSKDFIKSMNSV